MVDTTTDAHPPPAASAADRYRSACPVDSWVVLRQRGGGCTECGEPYARHLGERVPDASHGLTADGRVRMPTAGWVSPADRG